MQLERIRRWGAETKKAAKRAEGGRDGRIKLWVPLEEHAEGGEVILVNSLASLFDFGPAENWRRVMGGPWWQWFGKSIASFLTQVLTEFLLRSALDACVRSPLFRHEAKADRRMQAYQRSGAQSCCDG